MATIKFFLRTEQNKAPIYLKFTIGRGKQYTRKTGKIINPKDWSTTTSLPKQNEANNKLLSNSLKDLEAEVLNKYNTDYTKGEIIDGYWLEKKIKEFYNQDEKQKSIELITDYIEHYISLAHIKPNGKGGIGLSKSRINDFKLLSKLIKKFQGNKRYSIKDVNLNFKNEFTKWALDKENYSKGYTGRTLGTLKTMCLDAEMNGLEVSPQLRNVSGFKAKNEYVIYLTPSELEQIEKADLKHNYLNNARKFLLLGCQIGQRGGDLLELTEKNFITRNGLEVIELIQQKTAKRVTIPVLPKTKEIIADGLPKKISLQKFNDYIKEVCKIAKIDTITEGKKFNKDSNRKEQGKFPKYELVSSHICRRSMATNLFGILPTQLIMQITQHSTESMLMQYICKSGIDYAQQIADFYTKLAIAENKTPQQLTENLKAI
jgi:integrase